MEEESTLVARLRAGDEAAFEELVGRYNGPFLRLALTFVSSRPVAEEVVQETWLGVIKGLPTFEGRSSLKTWMFRILANRAKSRGVRERRKVPLSWPAAEEGLAAPPVDADQFTTAGRWRRAPEAWSDSTPEKILETRETREAVLAAIAELSARRRAVVTLRDIEGLDSNEVCNILGISETNQRVLLHRARSDVRSALQAILKRSEPSAHVP